MLDNEKDDIIKKELQKDKYISKQANDVFQNFYKMSSYEASNQTEKIHIESNSKMLFRWKALISVAASFVMVFSAGIAVYVNKDKINNSDLVAQNEDAQTSVAGIVDGKNAADYESIVVKNNEVIIDESDILRFSENDMIKAILTKEGILAIQLKPNFINTYNLRLDADKLYEIKGISKSIKDIFAGYIENSYTPYVFILLNDGTVQYVKVLNNDVSKDHVDELELYFNSEGQILGLENIIKFEQRKEYRKGQLYYFVVAISSTGVKKEIELGKYNDMTDGLENKYWYTTRDGKDTYYVDKENYIQTPGWNADYNGIYHIKDNDLYYVDLINGGEVKLIEGVEKIWRNKSSNGDTANVAVKLRSNSKILKEDNYLTLIGNATSKANVIETKEDENMVAYLHEDGRITIMFKSGGIDRITKNASGVIKENVKYDFSLKMDMYKNPEQEFKANTIYVGKIGVKEKECLAFATGENVAELFNITKYLEETDLECFDIKSISLSSYFIGSIRPDDKKNKITSIEPVVEEVRLPEDNSVVECTTLKCNIENEKSKSYFGDRLFWQKFYVKKKIVNQFMLYKSLKSKRRIYDEKKC